jgi:hypothetical protein
MLIAGIADIVSQRHQGMDLQTQPEYELYMDIATDPAESACSTKSKPFTDLLNRCAVQTELWKAVLNLRQGKYYNQDLSSFIVAIDACKNSVFDAADFAYVKDEGTILRKLLAAFSIRPTIVQTAPVYGISTNTSNIAALAVTHITTIAMITLRIPLLDVSDQSQSINLLDALYQQQLYIHNKQLTVKSQQIMYSREVIIFYVARRFQLVDPRNIARPYAMFKLPVTMNFHEKLHRANVYAPPVIQVGTQSFKITSIVAVETVAAQNGNVSDNMIIGCSALISSVDNNNQIGWYYNPLNMTDNDPNSITPLDVVAYDSQDSNNMNAIGAERGTLFIYSSAAEPTDDSLYGF